MADRFPRDEDDPFDFPDLGEGSAAPADAAHAEDPFDFPDLEAVRHEPEATASTPAPTPGPDASEQRVVREDASGYERDWLDELGRSAVSAVSGASANLLDEATGAGNYLAGKAGIRPEVSWDEAVGEARSTINPMREDYPLAGMAGGAALGMATAPVGGASVLGQAALAGGTSAASEWFDSYAPGRAAIAGGIGGALGAVGAKAGNWLSQRARYGLTPTQVREAELAEAAAEAAGRPPPAPAPPRPLPPPEPPPRLDLPDYGGPGYPPPPPIRPAPTVPVGEPPVPAGPPPPPAIPEGPMGPFPEGPRPLDAPTGPGYAPRYGELNPTPAPAGPPRPLPTPEAPPGTPPWPAPGPRVIRGAGGRFAPVSGTLDMPPYSPPPPARFDAPEPPYQGSEYLEHAALESVEKGARPRVGGPPIDQLDELLRPDYQLGGMPEGIEGAVARGARPRVGAPADLPPPEPRYRVGELEPAAQHAATRTGAQRPAFDDAPADYELGVLEELNRPAPRARSAVDDAMLKEQIAVERAQAGASGPGTLTKLADKGLQIAGWLGGGSMTRAMRAGLQASQLAQNVAKEPGKRLAANPAVQRQVTQIAYAGAPAINYAVQGALRMDDGAIPPAEREALTKAYLEKDQGMIATILYRAQQKSAAFAKSVQAHLKELQEQGESR